MRMTLTFRARILLIVLLVALVPLALVGLWLSRSAARSGEALIRSRLDVALRATVVRVQDNWIRLRSGVLGLTEHPDVRRALADGGTGPMPAVLSDALDRLDPGIVTLSVRDTAGREVWTLRRETSPASAIGPRIEGAVLTASQDIWEGLSDRRLGFLDFGLHADGLLGSGDVPPEAAGTVIGLFDSRTGVSLNPTPFDPLMLEAERFVWGGESWLTARRFMADPPVTVVVAANLAQFTVPFEDAARDGALLLLGVTLVGLVLAVAFTRRMTQSLERLSDAAGAVAAGDLGQRIDVRRSDEVGRVADAFNSMTASLEETLAELSRQQSLAAVGQFAASLAHEIRNPLTAIRVDLQRVQAGLDPDSPLRKPHERALREIARLNETVANALKRTRADGADTAAQVLDVRESIRAAADAAAPTFAEAGATLAADLPDTPLPVRGDPAGLEQLFLNLLQNAAQALRPGGRANVRARVEGDAIVLTVSDDGAGIPEDLQQRVFDPLFSTRSEGTGLGLTIARRIAEAHGGGVELESEPGAGTHVRVRLPRTP
ncbi:MAG: ATP-binding protein [Gemmatimonadota bacterium]|jgi:signal transduction histidine kinase